jgi:hypothetical protein
MVALKLRSSSAYDQLWYEGWLVSASPPAKRVQTTPSIGVRFACSHCLSSTIRRLWRPASSRPESSRSMRFEVCGMPYSTATPHSPGIASSFSTFAIASSDSFQERTSLAATPWPRRARKADRITASMSRVKTVVRKSDLVEW